MSSDTELDYLSPDFNPSSITVPRLREILVAHNVHYPASAKKSQLIEIFNANIVPQAKRILSVHKRIKRTSKGITDMPSSQEDLVGGDEDGNARLMLPPPTPSPAAPTPRRRPGRKSAKLSVPGSEESAEDGPGPQPSPKKTTARKSSGKHARASDTEPSVEIEAKRSTVRKTRRSEVAPDVRLGDPVPTGTTAAGDESVFSLDNPFQSGSSPVLGATRSPSGERKRKSLGTTANKDAVKRKSSSNRRKTDTLPSVKAEDGIVVPSSPNFETPMTRLTRKFKIEPEPDEADSVAVGEEFTPEEQVELAKERETKGGSAVEPYRPKRRKAGGVSKSAPWVVLLALLGGYATWWRREKLEVGYCGVGHSTVVKNVQIPEWADMILPECEPCPQHAYCYPYLQTTCEQDFVLKPHPLSLGGLVPLPPTCEPDGEKVRKVKQVADKAVEELRDRRAKWECGGLVDDEGNPTASLEVNEAELKREVGRKKRKGMSEVEFEELWSGALGEIVGREEVVSGTDGAKRHLTNLRHTNSLVPSLVRLTLDRLHTQATLHAQDPGAVREPWVSVGGLRDDVLRDEFSLERREMVWKRVRAVVERNANVRASVREGGNGEVGRVWEWIGGVGGAGEDSGGRRSARISLGEEAPSKWLEGVPLY
ncbi:MAG: inner nuclear membrane protein enriched at telomere/subtelomere region [Geoglossum umbratile]|nr:MAG: inner nuclear membrane protein enriched at telomere/subtelomere region [Geoglossum umbratile]